jgi:glycosyltransferase involved in cell wall biosynthesis
MLTELAGHLGITDRVTFTGHVPRPEAVMGAFDLFAITSDTEQMPYAVVEAMAARLPVLATAVGDIPAMVCEENQPFIVPPEDAHGLAAALTRLCKDERLRRRLGHANRVKVQEQFGIAAMADAFHRILVQATAPRY